MERHPDNISKHFSNCRIVIKCTQINRINKRYLFSRIEHFRPGLILVNSSFRLSFFSKSFCLEFFEKYLIKSIVSLFNSSCYSNFIELYFHHFHIVWTTIQFIWYFNCFLEKKNTIWFLHLECIEFSDAMQWLRCHWTQYTFIKCIKMNWFNCPCNVLNTSINYAIYFPKIFSFFIGFVWNFYC